MADIICERGRKREVKGEPRNREGGLIRELKMVTWGKGTGAWRWVALYGPRTEGFEIESTPNTVLVPDQHDLEGVAKVRPALLLHLPSPLDTTKIDSIIYT